MVTQKFQRKYLMDRRESLKTGIFGGLLTLTNAKREIVKNVIRNADRNISRIVPLKGVSVPLRATLSSGWGFPELSLKSAPEDNFYVNVTKMEKVYYHNEERLITE